MDGQRAGQDGLAAPHPIEDCQGVAAEGGAARYLQELADTDAAQSAQALKKWLHWAQRSRLQPFTDLAKTIRQHWAGILKAFDAAHLHTGYVEAVNSLLQAAKAKARGYGTCGHFIAMAFLIAGKLTHLPSNPLQKARA